MNIYQLKFTTGLIPKRLVYGEMMSENPSRTDVVSDKISGKEAISTEVGVNEVAAQSPSQIFHGTMSAGAAIKKKYTQSTTNLASLINDNPLGGGGSSGGGTGGDGSGGGGGTGDDGNGGNGAGGNNNSGINANSTSIETQNII